MSSANRSDVSGTNGADEAVRPFLWGSHHMQAIARIHRHAWRALLERVPRTSCLLCQDSPCSVARSPPVCEKWHLGDGEARPFGNPKVFRFGERPWHFGYL